MFTIKMPLSVLSALVFSVGILYGQENAKIVNTKERNGSTMIFVDPQIHIHQIIVNNGESLPPQQKPDTIFVINDIHATDTILAVDTPLVNTAPLSPQIPDSLLPALPDSLISILPDTLLLPCLTVKSNLLLDAAWLPNYGFCPLPNVAIEYFPRNQHWSYGISLDVPWWEKQDRHKYFQARNWQLESRRYFLCNKGEYRRLYVSAYAHLCTYAIALKGDRHSWIGEGLGGGLGAGYVWQLSSRWRVEAGVQAGLFLTRYDPFVYGDPIDHIDNGYYYYDWEGQSSDFQKRNYRYTWLGPTRLALSIAYNLFLRQRQKGPRL